MPLIALRVSAAYVGAVCCFYLTEIVLLAAGWHMPPVAAWPSAVIGWVAALTAIVWASGVRSLRATGMTNLRRWVRWVAVAAMTVATVAVAVYMLFLALVATGALIPIRAG